MTKSLSSQDHKDARAAVPKGGPTWELHSNANSRVPARPSDPNSGGGPTIVFADTDGDANERSSWLSAAPEHRSAQRTSCLREMNYEVHDFSKTTQLDGQDQNVDLLVHSKEGWKR